MAYLLCFFTLFSTLGETLDRNIIFLVSRAETGPLRLFHPQSPYLASHQSFEKILQRTPTKKEKISGESPCPQQPDASNEKRALLFGKNLEPNASLVTISKLLKKPDQYHKKPVRVRGTVTRLELHLDDTEFFIDFVFELKNGPDTVVVFGRHDRTQGDIQISTNRTVEVRGMFWKERLAKGHRLKNNLEAISVFFFPSLAPNQARFSLPSSHNLLHLPLFTNTLQ